MTGYGNWGQDAFLWHLKSSHSWLLRVSYRQTYSNAKPRVAVMLFVTCENVVTFFRNAELCLTWSLGELCSSLNIISQEPRARLLAPITNVRTIWWTGAQLLRDNNTAPINLKWIKSCQSSAITDNTDVGQWSWQWRLQCDRYVYTVCTARVHSAAPMWYVRYDMRRF